MATKKSSSRSQSRSSSSAASGAMGSNAWLMWVYVVGILAASIAAMFDVQNLYLSLLFALIGVVVGLFYFDSDDLMNFGLRYLIVTAAAGSLGFIPTVGSYITKFFTAFAAFLGPIILGMVVMFFWKKYFGKM